MLGYYQNLEETKKVLKKGWFRTGDYGYLDKDKFLYVTGRKRDIIVLKNGKNVYPQEIEFLINKIPYIQESIVYQRGESKTDTMLCAKIVYDPEILEETIQNSNHTPKIQEVKGIEQMLSTQEEQKEQHQKIIWEEIKKINQNLPIYKHIKKITITTTPFAKTTTQKIKRYQEI